jgi:hypothetical protein
MPRGLAVRRRIVGGCPVRKDPKMEQWNLRIIEMTLNH